MSTYKIVRHYQNDAYESEVVETGLTLEQARKHCNDPDTSSSAATSKWAEAITKRFGSWFDGYAEERE